ncbi:MAG: alpha/beta hydrolase [Actinomycetota bacterium]|nr:alpha/beta hydrolase [Actinomycetota bacterium]
MSTFVLMHGSSMGAWCWDRLGAELEAGGHRAVAMDLPCDDPSAGAREYAEAALAAIQVADDDLVVVGHSIAGLAIPLIADARPVRRLVFLGGAIPQPGRSLGEQLAEEPDMLSEEYKEAGALWEDEERAIYFLFPDCSPEVAREAASRLRPQRSDTLATEAFPLHRLPDVDTSYIVCSEDRTVSPRWSRRAAKERLGVEAVEIPGGHSPFLSRPGMLAHLLTS